MFTLTPDDELSIQNDVESGDILKKETKRKEVDMSVDEADESIFVRKRKETKLSNEAWIKELLKGIAPKSQRKILHNIQKMEKDEVKRRVLQKQLERIVVKLFESNI